MALPTRLTSALQKQSSSLQKAPELTPPSDNGPFAVSKFLQWSPSSPETQKADHQASHKGSTPETGAERCCPLKSASAEDMVCFAKPFDHDVAFDSCPGGERACSGLSLPDAIEEIDVFKRRKLIAKSESHFSKNLEAENELLLLNKSSLADFGIAEIEYHPLARWYAAPVHLDPFRSLVMSAQGDGFRREENDSTNPQPSNDVKDKTVPSKTTSRSKV